MNTLAAVEFNAGEQVTFWICAILSVIGALGLVLSRKTVHSALFVAMTMINLAVLYVANSAPFLGMVQVVVYTGAIMMLFLFVLMIVGVDASDSLVETIKGQRLVGLLFGLGLGVLVTGMVGNAMSDTTAVGLEATNSVDGGNLQGIARVIFTDFLFAFEATSALLITAALGAMVLAHTERYEARATQRELSEARILGGSPGPLAPPGVYARHNSVDTPALLPDGTPLPESVPDPVRGRGDLTPVNAAAVRETLALAHGEPIIAPPPGAELRSTEQRSTEQRSTERPDTENEEGPQL